MIHVLGSKVDREQLKDIPLIRPEHAGNRWRGIQHEELASAVESALHSRGIDITSQTWSVEKKGAALVGGLDLRLPQSLGIPDIPGMEYSLGLSHTNDCSRALKFAVGSRVMVCQNGMVTGLLILHRKHTTGLDLDQEVNSGIDRYIAEARGIHQTVTQMKTRWISDATACRALIEAGRQRLLPWSHLKFVDREWRNPGHEEFKPKTAWSLYNSFTEVAKNRNPESQLQALNTFRQIVLN